MKKNRQLFIFSFILLMFTFGVRAQVAFTGDGTVDSPYLIETAADMTTLATQVKNGTSYEGTFFKLDTNITLNNWTPIGTDTYPFKGSFDGDNHTITMMCTIPQPFAASLFMYTQNATIQNLTMAGTFHSEETLVIFAAFVCVGENTNIINCHNTASITNSNVNAFAGIVYALEGGRIENCSNSSGGSAEIVAGIAVNFTDAIITGCSNSGNLSGTVCAGGIAAFGDVVSAKTTYFTDCINSGNISISEPTTDIPSGVGGILGIGIGSGKTVITRCANEGEISTTSSFCSAGGIIGRNRDQATLSGCFNIGNITSSDTQAGGIIGVEDDNHGTTLTSCFNTGTINGSSTANSGGLYTTTDGGSVNIQYCYYLNTCGGTGAGTTKTELEMEDPAFVDTLNQGGSYYNAMVQNPNIPTGSSTTSTIVFSNVNTLDATDIHASSATLNGNVVMSRSTGPSSNRFGFAYKKSTESEDDYIHVPAIETTLPNFEQTIDNLTPNTTYDFYFYAEVGSKLIQDTKRTFTTSVCPSSPDGGGDADDPFLIECEEHLEFLSVVYDQLGGFSPNSYFKLTADLDLSSESSWKPIGRDRTPFNGTFDGNGHYIQLPNAAFGIFGYTENATIHDLVAKGTRTVNATYAGGIVGHAKNTTILHCANLDPITNSHDNSYTGGIAGYLEGESNTIKECYNKGSITGDLHVGGIAGESFGGNNSGSTIVGSYNMGNVTATYEGGYAGGIVGECRMGATTIKACYNHATISSNGQNTAGGLVGTGTGTGTGTEGYSIVKSYYTTTSGSFSHDTQCAIALDSLTCPEGKIVDLNSTDAGNIYMCAVKNYREEYSNNECPVFTYNPPYFTKLQINNVLKGEWGAFAYAKALTQISYVHNNDIRITDWGTGYKKVSETQYREESNREYLELLDGTQGIDLETDKLNFDTEYYIYSFLKDEDGNHYRSSAQKFKTNPCSTNNATIEVSKNPACYNGSVTLTANASGNAFPNDVNRTYLWSNGATTQSITANNLTLDAEFSVTITSEYNCSVTATKTVTVSPALTVTFANKTDVSCHGQSTGAIDITVSGGTGNKTYAWTKQGDDTFSSNSQNLSYLAAGTYQVTVTDENNCTASLQNPVQITQPDAITATFTPTHVKCFGDTTGKIKVENVAGGTAPYQYKLGNGEFGSTATFSSLGAGSYSVTVKDEKNCTLTQNEIAVNQPTAQLQITNATTICNSNEQGIAYTIAGGTPNYTAITTPSTTANTHTTAGDYTFSNLNQGDYTITVTDGNGCEVTSGSITIQKESTQLQISAQSGSKTYDGTALTKPMYNITFGQESYSNITSGSSQTLTNGDVVTATVSGSVTNVETKTNAVASVTVMRGTKVVTCEYNITTTNGYLTVTKRTLTIKPNRVSKVYDGTPLTSDAYTTQANELLTGHTITSITFTGEQTDTGKCINRAEQNSVVIKDASNNDVTNNYKINCETNLLVVTPRDITIKAKGASKNYDGTPLTESGFTVSEMGTDNGLVSGHKVTSCTVEGSQTEAGTSPNIPSAAVIKDADSNIVTKNYRISYQSETLRVNKSNSLTLTCPSGTAITKVYNGTPLAPAAEVTDQVDGDVIPLLYKKSDETNWSSEVPSITNVGSITIDVKTNNNNYSEKSCSYTLEVTASDALTLTCPTAANATKVYDANPFAPTAEVTNQVDGDVITIEYSTDNGGTWSTAAPSIINVGTRAVKVRTNNANYNTKECEYTLSVTQRSVTITAASDSKVYDGTALTNNGYTSSGLVSGHTVTSCTVTGSQTAVGSSNNVPSEAVIKDADSNIVTANYDITYATGTLTVTADTEDPCIGCDGGVSCTTIGDQTKDNDANQSYYTHSGTAWDITATDNSGATPSLAWKLTGATTAIGNTTLNGQRFNIGATTVTWKATDPSGNTATCTFVVTVNDVDDPTMNCPTISTVYACTTAVPAPYVNYAAFVAAGGSASDNHAIDETSFEVVTPDAFEGTTCNGGLTRTYRITDVSGNPTTCTQVFTIQDTEAPALTSDWPQNITGQNNCFANRDISGLYTNDQVKALFEDCSDITVTHQDAETATSDCGWTITRTYTIKDACNNEVTNTMSVSGSDQTAPALTSDWPQNITGQNNCFANRDISGLYTNDQVKALYSDCSTITVEHTDAETATSDCGWTITRTYTIKDACNNEVPGTHTMSISGSDQTAPTFTCPTNISICRGEDGISYNADSAVTGKPTDITDNCSDLDHITISFSDETSAMSTEGVTTITRTWKATDACGNPSSEQTQVITVKASLITAGVTINCTPMDITMAYGFCDTLISLTPATHDAASKLSGRNVTLTCTNADNETITSDVRLAEGQHTFTWTLTDDECGHEISCEQTVIIRYPDCGEGITVTDVDGNIYNTVRQGCECWTKSNLRSTKYSDNSSIATAVSFNNDNTMVETFGLLYSWYSAVKVTEDDNTAMPETTYTADYHRPYVQGACPAGWAIPSAADFSTLDRLYGESIKSTNPLTWIDGSAGEPPVSGFDAVANGFYSAANSQYEEHLATAYYWTWQCTPTAPTADGVGLHYHCEWLKIEEASKRNRYSIRCIRKE